MNSSSECDKNNKPSTDSTADPNPEPNNSKDQDDDSVKNDVPTSDPSTNSAADPNPEPNNSKDQDNNSVKKDKSTLEPSTDSTSDPSPESDKPTGSEEEEKELEEKEEKDPEEKFKEEEKGGFVYRFWTWYKNNLGVSIPLTYIFYIIVYMVVVEIMQQKDMRENGADGICFDLVKDDDDNDKIDEKVNIKPFFGWWKNFTNKDRFNRHESDLDCCTIDYKGSKRILINLLAAATFAKYKGYYVRLPMQ